MTQSLEERVLAFYLLELPGQPQFMHMGTRYLVTDLMAEVQRLRQVAGELGALALAATQRPR